MKHQKRIMILVLLIVIAIGLTGCLPGIGGYTEDKPAGFFSGIWHGWLAPLSLILSLGGSIEFYESTNTGWWYNFGFYIAIISGFGGVSLSRRKRKNK